MYLQKEPGMISKIPGHDMKKFLMELFVRHSWKVAGSTRHCSTCGRRDIEQFEQGAFFDGLDWNCVDSGDVNKHWS